MKINRKSSLLITIILLINAISSIPFGTSDSGYSSEVLSLLESNSFIFDIKNGSGEVYFYPTGNVAIETQGKLNLSYVGEYMEWGEKELFFDITFIHADGTVNITVKNISQSTIGMNLIWGFGGFSPNFVSSTNWTQHDEYASSVANAPSSEGWPSLNGILSIERHSGLHIYNYSQNPLNGTQKAYLAYRESTGILTSFKSSFSKYYLEAELISPDFFEENTIAYLDQNILSYEILTPSKNMYFYPIGYIALELNGHINLTYVGEYFEYGSLDLFFDIIFIHADGSINSTAQNISQSSIGMNLIWGFGGFSPNLIPLNTWEKLDQAAIAVADAPSSEGWPSLNGEIEISDEIDYHSFNYTQNPMNGTQHTYLKYDKNYSILSEFHSTFGNYDLHAKLLSSTIDEIKQESNIPGFSYISIFLVLGVCVVFISSKNIFRSRIGKH